MKVVIEITLGNEAMADVFDAAQAIETILPNMKDWQESGTIFDYNGNKVGKWETV